MSPLMLDLCCGLKGASEPFRAAERAADRADDALFQAWLNSATPNVPRDWDGRPNRLRQLQALGGMSAARALYAAHKAA